MTTQKIALTIPEVCEASGLGRASVYRAFHDGKLTPRKFGSKTLVMVSELERFLTELPTRIETERWPGHRRKQKAA